MSKKNIKIFVSHRIDLDSRTIDNELFVPIRCGAVFDKRDDIDMLGDDTGDNISEKRELYCELTVMYWIWKNEKSDYVGLAHYRRFLSFSLEHIKADLLGIGFFDNMADINLEKAGLLNEERMRDVIENNDWICAKSYDISVPFPGRKSARDAWTCDVPEYISKENFDVLLKGIQQVAPEYYDDALEYMNGKEFLGFNCCIGRKELFDDLCSFMFGILFHIEKRIINNMLHYSEQSRRVFGYIGEWLFSIWIYHQKKKNCFKIKELQLVTFADTSLKNELVPIEGAYPIVFSADIPKLPEIAVCIQSIVDNAGVDDKFDFIILYPDALRGSNNEYLMNEMMENLCNHWRNDKRVYIRHFDPKDNIGESELHPFGDSDIRSYRYLICLPWILKNYKKTKVLYLSDKLIANTNIVELFDQELEDKAIGATIDVLFMGTKIKSPNLEEYKKIKFVEDPWKIFSADVVLMDLDKVRERYDINELSIYADKEQDASLDVKLLNINYAELIKTIGSKYNYYGNTCAEFRNMLRDHIPFEIKKEYDNIKQPVLINLHNGNGFPLFKEQKCMADFWHYARRTPFYEVLLGRMWEGAAWGASQAVLNKLNHVAGENCYARFIFPWKAVKPGARIIIYGGGIVGKMFLKQVANNPYCHIVAICDIAPQTTGIIEAPVINLNELGEIDEAMYDLVLIALERKDIAISVRKDLELMGIPPQKIKWVDPVKK